MQAQVHVLISDDTILHYAWIIMQSNPLIYTTCLSAGAPANIYRPMQHHTPMHGLVIYLCDNTSGIQFTAGKITTQYLF